MSPLNSFQRASFQFINLRMIVREYFYGTNGHYVNRVKNLVLLCRSRNRFIRFPFSREEGRRIQNVCICKYIHKIPNRGSFNITS